MDVNYIKGIIQTILNDKFSIVQKRSIHAYPDRINMACPYCGDSQTHSSKKRGNLYLNTLMYTCFRGSCGKKTTFTKMAKDFNIQLDPDKKMEMIEHMSNSFTFDNYSDNFIDAQFDGLIDIDDISNIFNNTYETPITGLSPVKKGSKVSYYLQDRGITMIDNIYEATFWKNDTFKEPVIVFLNKRGNKVLGMQIRNLKEGKARLFKIYNYETLYKWVNRVDEVDHDEVLVYNKLSYFFNILNVDFTQTITVFEGYIDSLFYPNSIGIVGVNTDMRFLESNNIDIQYFFDNDDAGYDKSIEKINIGFRVFLWKKLFDDIVKKKRSKDPYDLLRRISTVKDLNKLSTMVDKPYSTLELYNYFSIDIYDKIYIPDSEKVKKEKERALKFKRYRK